MTALPLRLHPSPFEMPTSFASRLAQRNQCISLAEFAEDVGLDVQSLGHGDPAALKHLCELASLEETVFANTTVYPSQHKSLRVGCEIYRSSVFARGEIRFCGACIAGDVKSGRAIWHAVHRSHWQIRHVSTCIEHHCPLQTVKTNGFMFRNLDSSRVFADYLERCGDSSKIEHGPASEFERYLSGRAYGHQHKCWADQLEVFALFGASEALGLLIERGPNAKLAYLNPSDTARFAEMGFKVIKGGPSSLRDCWEAIRKSPSFCDGKGRYQHQPRFGAFQKMLASNLKYRTDFEPIRRVFRDYLINTFPYSDGANVLGTKLKRRRLHSLITAKRAIGRRTDIFRDKLEAEGLATRDDSGRLVVTKPLTVAYVERFSRDMNALLYEREAAACLGVSIEILRILVSAGLSPASCNDPKHRHKAFLKDGLDLYRKGLVAGLSPIQTVARDQSMITKAPVRLNCDFASLVAAILEKRLKPAGLWRGKERLDHIVIDLAAAKEALPKLERPRGIQRIPAFRMLRFNSRTLNHLVQQNLLSGFKATHPDTRVKTEFICTQSIKKFNEKYVSLGILADYDDATGGPQFARLRKAGMHPMIDEPGLSKIYRRCDLNPIYADVGLELDI